MSHDNDVADIAWMRNLAAEGERAPMRGGSILMAAGLIYGAASLVRWAGIDIGVPGVEGAEWLIATAVFLIVNFVVVMRLRRSGGVRTAANRAVGAAWMGVGYGIFAMFAAMAVTTWRLGEGGGSGLFWMIPSIIMVFYGMGWAVTAAMTKSGPLYWLATASFVAAPILAAFSGQDVQYLAYAIALALLMALPGFLLMRAAARADQA